MLDINFKENNQVFNFRVAAIIRKDNQILLQKSKEVNYYGLIGGRVQINEDSKCAIKREVFEETGLKLEIKKELALVENFFTSNYNGKKYHEILIIYELDYLDEIKEIKNMENKKDLKYVWLDIKTLENINIEPKFISNLIKENLEFKHIINKEY